MTATMNISMPDSLKAFVDERVRSGGYGSHSEYLRELVRRDEQQAAAERLRALIAEGLNSPQGRDWRDLKADLLKRAAAQDEACSPA
ncbi:MAG: type II toxin-antitoxin system ParD family antitoxin [Asticcacaulis sp.]|uniref:type II toxin-antitoxin system ParD family antitoxin n=1 Tax=Asticcacaulis sp. TaxID=1872648 RepID=UPI003F7CB09C